jgi:hypothetical protein
VKRGLKIDSSPKQGLRNTFINSSSEESGTASHEGAILELTGGAIEVTGEAVGENQSDVTTKRCRKYR